MKKLFFTYLFLSVLSSCQTAEKVEKPDNLLTKDKMVNILSDIAILKSASDVNSTRLSNFIDTPFDYVTEKYEVDSLTIAKNIEYYNFQFNDNLSIYRRVEERIKIKKEKIDSINTVIDSLKRKSKENSTQEADIKSST